MNKIAIVGIHTGIGKTVASALICEATGADYWKPVQAGSLNETDSDVAQKLISNPTSVIHKEAFLLTQPMSPHAAARIDGVKIEIEKIQFPQTENLLIIETAGGLMSPLNDTQTNLDFILHFNLPVILVSQNYLGSINHSLLTINVLKSNGVNVLGILFNGTENIETQKYILNYSRLPIIGLIEHLEELTKASIHAEAEKINFNLPFTQTVNRIS